MQATRRAHRLPKRLHTAWLHLTRHALPMAFAPDPRKTKQTACRHHCHNTLNISSSLLPPVPTRRNEIHPEFKDHARIPTSRGAETTAITGQPRMHTPARGITQHLEAAEPVAATVPESRLPHHLDRLRRCPAQPRVAHADERISTVHHKRIQPGRGHVAGPRPHNRVPCTRRRVSADTPSTDTAAAAFSNRHDMHGLRAPSPSRLANHRRHPTQPLLALRCVHTCPQVDKLPSPRHKLEPVRAPRIRASSIRRLQQPPVASVDTPMHLPRQSTHAPPCQVQATQPSVHIGATYPKKRVVACVVRQ